MSSCEAEMWTLKKLTTALINKKTNGKKLVVPMFQRGKRWTTNQENTFIDSLMKGYPIGTMLFYKRIENSREIYLLIDGLQRSNTVRKYMEAPTQFFNTENISDASCSTMLAKIERDDEEYYFIIRNELVKFIREQKEFDVQYIDVAEAIVEIIEKRVDNADKFNKAKKLAGAIADFFKNKKEEYDRVSNISIPVIVYSGDEGTLPEIFTRINSKGTPLDQYEIYAASWPTDKKFSIENDMIVNYVAKKYEALIKEGYNVHDFNKNELLKTKSVNAFEYLFGLSKYLNDTYSDLKFKSKQETDDMVNSIAFELVNACLNDTNKISTLYEKINKIDINAFEKALKEAIKFVVNTIAPITKFKGNKHKEGKNNIFHSKFQILSMISTTFKEMYPNENYSEVDKNWNEKKSILIKNMKEYYVYDILTNEWSEGGTAKIHRAAKPNRYMQTLSGRTWAVALNGFFERSLRRTENTKIPNPKSEELVFLNCIYLQTFSALDQLSEKKFDVEHIATKEQMKDLIKACKGQGLPISCIANLCYLPEYDNRSKGKNNFYQDKIYKTKVNIEEIEQKYSFTYENDLKWMDSKYSNFEDLKKEYEQFLTKRFEILKQKFCLVMEIEYVKNTEINDKKTDNVDNISNGTDNNINNKLNSQAWITVQDKYDFTSKKIIIVQIDNKKIETKNVTNAYCEIHKFLYEIDKQVYTSSKINWFSKTANELRVPYRIHDAAFIEKNKSNNAKMKTIKDIISIMSQPPSIKYKIED